MGEKTIPVTGGCSCASNKFILCIPLNVECSALNEMRPGAVALLKDIKPVMQSFKRERLK